MSRSVNHTFDSVRLDEFLVPVGRPAKLSPDGMYREIGIRSHGKGIFHKDPISGADLGDKRCFHVEVGTLVFNIVFAWEGAVAVAGPDEAGFIASHRFPMYRVNSKRANTRYVLYLFQTNLGQYLLEKHSPGSAGRNRTLDQKGLLKERVPLPSVTNQEKLVAILDRQLTAIDSLITKKAQLSTLLAEKRQALITRAVTKGLDPTVPMKDSGVPWIGSVPTHWGVKKVGYILRRLEQGWSPDCLRRPPEPEEWGVLKAGAVNSGELDELESKALPPELEPDLNLEVRIGDILMSRANGSPLFVGAVGVVRKLTRRLILCDKLYRLSFDTRIVEPEFAVMVLQSHIARKLIDAGATGQSTLRNIGQEYVRAMVFAWPPIEEQRAIITFVNGVQGPLQDTLDRIRAQIDLLREYRQALITAAVTGQIDVTSVDAYRRVDAELEVLA